MWPDAPEQEGIQTLACESVSCVCPTTRPSPGWTVGPGRNGMSGSQWPARRALQGMVTRQALIVSWNFRVCGPILLSLSTNRSQCICVYVWV